MSIYTIDVHTVVHTCPGSNQPHTLSSRRSIIAVTPGGPCKTPIASALDPSRLLACGRILPTAQQCQACKPLIIVNNTTVTDLGQQGPHQAGDRLGRHVGRFTDHDGHIVEVYR